MLSKGKGTSQVGFFCRFNYLWAGISTKSPTSRVVVLIVVFIREPDLGFGIMKDIIAILSSKRSTKGQPRSTKHQN